MLDLLILDEAGKLGGRSVGEQNQRAVVDVVAQGDGGDLVAGERRHPYVEQDQIGALAPQHRGETERRPVGGDLVPAQLQDLPDDLAHDLAVVDEKDLALAHDSLPDA